jgi:hypothetical protein
MKLYLTTLFVILSFVCNAQVPRPVYLGASRGIDTNVFTANFRMDSTYKFIKYKAVTEDTNLLGVNSAGLGVAISKNTLATSSQLADSMELALRGPGTIGYIPVYNLANNFGNSSLYQELDGSIRSLDCGLN